MLRLLDSFRAMISGSLLWLLPAILAAAMLAFFVYRATNPAVERHVRLGLATLRTSALLLIILAIFELTLQLRWQQSAPPLLAVALDQSASMQVEEGTESRAAALMQIVREELPRHRRSELALRYYGFAGHTVELSEAAAESLSFAGDATNITAALESIRSGLLEQNLAAILLISDGNYTSGGDPGRYAAEIGLPVYTIGLGSPAARPDIGISGTEANPFAFVGESTPVRINVRSTSGRREKIHLSLLTAEGEAAAATIDLPPGPVDSAVVLPFRPARDGRQKLNLLLTASGDDANKVNNRATLYVDVLKSRTRIYIMAGALSPDISFLRQHLQASERFDLRLLAELSQPGGAQERLNRALQDSIDQADLFVLYNYPGRTTPSLSLERLQQSLERRARPLLFVSGRDPAWNRLAPMEPFLPFHADPVTTGIVEITPVLTPAGSQHPVMQIPGNGAAAWGLLPPVFTQHRLRSWWPDAEILAQARPAGAVAAAVEGRAWPLIMIRPAGAKSAAIIGYDLWRWHLMMAGIGNEQESYHHFLHNLVRWLQMEQNSNLIRVQSDQALYHFGDQVRITAQVVDAQFQAVADAEVQVTIHHNGTSGRSAAGAQSAPAAGAGDAPAAAFFLRPGGDGSYKGDFRPQAAGDYQLTAQVVQGGRSLGTATHLFSVGSYNQELAEVTLKEELLRRIAAASGGRYAGEAGAAGLIASISGTRLTRTLTQDFEVWNRWLLLAAILLLLAAEWFIRRRKGML